MDIAVYILVSFALLRMLIALINFITRPYLKPGASIMETPRISILIPARNEEDTIADLLSDIEKLSYPNHEVIVYNDASEDKTEQIVQAFMKENKNLRLLQGDELPKGWLGKNHACHKLSEAAEGKYYLFLDADVRIETDILEKAVSVLHQRKPVLLSLFPKQIMISKGEKKVVPIMNQILLSLLPLFLVRASKKTSLSAANGQFMFFSAGEYDRLKPHEKFKNSAVEDISIVKYYKKKRHKCVTLLGSNDVSCRMYHSESEALEGFSKNVLHFFGNSIVFAAVYVLISNFGIFFVLFFGPDAFALIYFFSTVINKLIVSAASKQSIRDNMLFWIFHQLNFNKLVIKAIQNRSNRKLIWKGRNIYG